MSWKRPAIAALVAAILFCVFLVDREGSRRAAFAEWRMVDIEEADSTLVEIRNQHGEIRLEKRGPADWVLVADGRELPASIGDVRAVIDNLRGAKKGVSFPAARFAEFGLEDAPQVVRLVGETPEGEPRDYTIRFGDDTQQLGQVYAYVEGGGEIFTVGDWVRNQASRSAASLRDRRLLAFDPQSVEGMRLASRRDEWGIDRVGRQWILDRAGTERMPADDALVARMMRVLESLRALEIQEDAPEEDLGFDPPLLRIELETADGLHFLDLGDPIDGGQSIHARSTRIPGAATLRLEAVRELLAPPGRWGTREMIWFPAEEFVRIETGTGGRVAMDLERRADGEWRFADMPGIPPHPRKLAEFLETLDQLAATEPADTGRGRADEAARRAAGVRDEGFFVRVTSADGRVHGFRQGQIDFNEGEFGALMLLRTQDETIWKTDPREAQFYFKTRSDLADNRIAVGFAEETTRIEHIDDDASITIARQGDRWTVSAPGVPTAVVRASEVRELLLQSEDLEWSTKLEEPTDRTPIARLRFLSEDGRLLHFIEDLGEEPGGYKAVRTPQGEFQTPIESFQRFATALTRVYRTLGVEEP